MKLAKPELKGSAVADSVSGLSEVRTSSGMFIHTNKISAHSLQNKRQSKLMAGRGKGICRGSGFQKSSNNYDVSQTQRYDQEDDQEYDQDDDQEYDQEDDQEEDQEDDQEVDFIQTEIEHDENDGSASYGTLNTRKESRALAGTKKKSVDKGKLIIEVDECARRLIGEDSQYLITRGGCVMREHAKFDGTTWKRQPFLLKKDIIAKYTENSNFDPKSKTMVHAIDSQLGNQHRSRQYLFHLHYRKYPTKEQAINHPPEGIKARDWVLLCEKFASEQFQKMSARNKVNRAANELPPTVGSRSVARTIDMKRRKGEEVTLIDHFGIAHYSEKKKEMVSEKAKEIWTGIQNNATTSSSTPAEICLKWLKRVPGHLKGRSALKKEILANVRLREQVEHERKRAEASEEKVEQLTETCSTLLKENKDIKRKMGYVLDQLAHFTGVQIPQEFDD